ncbi:hypothetical protein [Legionella bozemanae]|uniref:Uncharacterized protein n=1 Tax=Legionella bozemanae TaxID=447 RepID=A0A0W0RQA3_LEGBO|nr:hypothetical protein [Legionella bozemanae]KTC73263.1 hypothetical protein Lboz_1909 [Legionella bozemanae]STO34625.1 Uncharacterised protein [Legionella bozemanae]
MGFYFNTFRQQQGDIAYNEQRYEEALMHYSEALKTLYLHAASKSTRYTDFYDALVYVLSENIITKLQLIRREAQDGHFNAIANYWQEIPSLLHEMEITHKEHLAGKKHSISNEEQVIKKTNELLAAVCEEVSDAIVDQMEAEEDSTEISLTLPQAIDWMNRAINFQMKTKDCPKLSSSLGYLNLLERHYKETNDENILTVMSEYINKHKLREATIQSPLRKLELLSYVTRLTLFNDEDISELVHECKRLSALLSDEERENPILEDLQNLVQLISHEESQLEDMEKTEETYATSDMEENEDNSIAVVSEESDLSSNHPVTPMDLQNSGSEIVPPPTLAPPSVSVFQTSTQTMVQSISLSFSNQGFGATPQGFFSTALQSQASEDMLPYSRAFQSSLEKITTDSSNPKFLANLLSLIADFFGKYRADGVQKQNAIVLTFDLYQQVLKIDPGHNRAAIKVKELYIQHQKLIGPYKHFSHGYQSPLSVAPKISEAKNCFNQALEELTIQLESFLMNKPNKIEKTINDLIDFIGQKLSVITSTPSSEIRATLTQTFQEVLRNAEAPNNPPSVF